MKKFRRIIIYISIGVIILTLTFVNYDDLVSRSNLGNLLGIIAMLFNILSMILSNRYEDKNKNA